MHDVMVIPRMAAAQETLCDWIRAGTLRWQDFIHGQFPVNETAAAMEQVRSRKMLKAVLRFE